MWPFQRKQAIASRLTPAEAYALAGPALAPRDRAEARHATLREADGRLSWNVATIAIGSGALVTIDDRDGSIVSVGRWGVR